MRASLHRLRRCMALPHPHHGPAPQPEADARSAARAEGGAAGPSPRPPPGGKGGRIALFLLLALSACGDLPQPFLGRPGATALRLAQPPPSRLSVPAPTQALLPDDAAGAWAGAVAEALAAEEIPATTGRTRRGDWSLQLAAEIRGNEVIPSYTVQNPAGEPQGMSEGAPVPVRAWAGGDPSVLKAAAAQAAPGIASLLGRIDAARRQSDPNSLQNRPARIHLAGVTGAPGDGNRSLPAQMRAKLSALGLVVQDTVKDADYILQGDVAAVPGAGGTTRIELQWIVTDAKGERGRILQLNEVPRGSLDRYWGDVAVAAATEAAAGVRDVVANAAGTRAKE